MYVRTIILASCTILAACATQSGDRSLAGPVDAPGQVGVVNINGVDVGVTKGVAEIIEAEDRVDTRDRRLRCTRTKRTGSHRVMRLCQTVSEAEDQAKRSQNDLERLHRLGKITDEVGL